MINRLGLMLLTILLLGAIGAVHADGPVAVVMSDASDADRLTREEVVNIFLGRFRQLPSGQLAVPVDRPEDLELMADFYRLLVGKTPPEIRAYWSRLIFSGKTAPPRQAKSVEDLLERLADEPGAIGYMRPAERTARVKVVLTLGQ